MGKSSKTKPAKGKIDSLTAIKKKKPSKVELKYVIEAMQKDGRLTSVRLALKYIPHYLKSDGLTKKFLLAVISLWSEGGEKVRIICLLSLIRVYTKLQDPKRKEFIIKKLYNSFVDKCRVAKRETMSMIGFMRHSLIELYKLDPRIAFKQAQASCQQLTLTLKNALTHKNEETSRTVLNWQFASCLILLSQMIISHEDNSPVKSLTHQVIQLNLGAITFLTSPRYFPYYCHLIENLVGLGEATNLFIPVLPLMMAILDRLEVPVKKDKLKENGNIKNTHDSEEDRNSDKVDSDKDEKDEDGEGNKRKVYSINLLNHVSIEETRSFEYNVAVLDKIHELMVKYLASQCHRISFPELVLLPCVHLKKWLKKNPGHPAQKFKTLLEKVRSNCEELEESRHSVDFLFTDYSAVDAWEKRMRDSDKLSLAKLDNK